MLGVIAKSRHAKSRTHKRSPACLHHEQQLIFTHTYTYTCTFTRSGSCKETKKLVEMPGSTGRA